MAQQAVKEAVKLMCPPLVWKMAHRAYRAVVPTPSPFRMLSTRAEVDALIATGREAAKVSDTALRKLLAQHRFRPPTDLPADPDSAEYRDRQMKLYQLISGRDLYAADDCEATPFDLAAAKAQPYPYRTRDGGAVGEHLMGIGFLLRAMSPPAGGRILELGSGYGSTTVEMAKMGLEVTALDIYEPFIELGRYRCGQLGLEADFAVANMLDYQPAKRFDRVLFFKSFHHCNHHQQMVARLDQLVKKDGAVVFAGEPVKDDFHCPWGVRLDGQSLWGIRAHGWLELGFHTDYFMQLLDRHGWQAQRWQSQDVHWQSVIIARRKPA